MTWDELKRIAKKADARGLFFEPHAALKRVKKTRRPVRSFVEAQTKTAPRPFLDLMESPRGESKALEHLSAETGLHENV